MKSHSSFAPQQFALSFFATALLLCCGRSAASQQTNPDDFVKGKNLLAQLSSPPSSNTTADKAVFQKIGYDESEQYLLAVMAADQTPSATPDDWKEMHRAFDALIELNVIEDRLYKASIYANLQDQTYRHDEADYTLALAAARQALDLQQRSGETTTIFIPWKAVAEDLIQLGRFDEGLDDLYNARSLVKDPTMFLAAELWSEIISLESSRGHAATAHKESAAFLAAATPSTPPIFRAYAFLAAANINIDEHRFDDAAIQLHAALNASLRTPEQPRVTIQIMNSLMSIAMEAVHSLPREQAFALCARLDAEFPHLPTPLSVFANKVVAARSNMPPVHPAAPRAPSKSTAYACDMGHLEDQIATTRLDLAHENGVLLRSTGRTPEALNERLVTLEASLAQARRTHSCAKS